MRRASAVILAFGLVLCFEGVSAESQDPISVFKSGNYVPAIALLRSAMPQNPADPVLRSALLSALVYEGRVDEASDAAEADAKDFPASPEVIAARGEWAYYLGDLPEAEKLFRAALKLKDDTPRAYYGLYRLFRAASMYRSARLFCLKAHSIDPDDALITLAFLGYVVGEKRSEMEQAFISSHPWFYKHFERQEQTSSELKGELNERKAFELQGERKETSLHLFELRDSPTRVRGLGLELSLERGQHLRMLFDTGASGILVRQSAVDKAGLNHLGSFETWGIGDKGHRNAFAAVSETCDIGSLHYKTCVIRSVEGKGRIAGDEDGLIGADFFADYIIRIDFQKHELRLTPQPERPPNPQGYDRTVSPEEAGFTPVFRFGPHLYVLTKVNGKTSGLFLLDTGSQLSNVDSTFARLSTKIHGDSYLHVKGLSGEVKDVFEAEKAELQFARFRQSNLGLTAFNLNNSGEHQEVRMAGILGLPVLSMFRLTLDYRNGLVNFDYIQR